MSKILAALLLGIIQGITEFLPISSSGHLLLAGYLFGVPSSLFFTLLLHAATLIAVIFVFWKDVVWLIRHPISKQMAFLIFSTFTTVAIALLITTYIPGSLEGMLLGPAFILTGVLLILSHLLSKRVRVKEMNLGSSLIVGIAQGFAVLPGLSRSGTTISTLKFLGLENEKAASFSFLLSVPIILGGMAREIASSKGSGAFGAFGVLPCLIGFAAAFIFGLASLFLFKKLIKNNKWWVFAPYVIILGIAVTIWQYT